MVSNGELDEAISLANKLAGDGSTPDIQWADAARLRELVAMMAQTIRTEPERGVSTASLDEAESLLRALYPEYAHCEFYYVAGAEAGGTGPMIGLQRNSRSERCCGVLPIKNETPERGLARCIDSMRVMVTEAIKSHESHRATIDSDIARLRASLGESK